MTELEEAVKFVNEHSGRSPHTPLVEIVICDVNNHGCGEPFPAQTRTITRARLSGHPLICPACAPKYHREKRRVSNQMEDKLDPSASWRDMKLKVRARKALDRLGVKTIGEIADKVTSDDIIAYRGCGPSTVKEIKDHLAIHGLALRS